MPLTSGAVAALCAFCLWSAGLADRKRPDLLTVLVNVEFDRSIASHAIQAGLEQETAAIWHEYGVELVWSIGSLTAPEAGVGAALHLDVIVAGHKLDDVLHGSASVLGCTTIDPSGTVRGPIRISADAIDSLLQQRPDANPVLHAHELGRALGRVLAHELGHVLLGLPTYHDRTGLMRARFPVGDLTGHDRHRFRLTDDSAGRVRAQIAHLSAAQE